MISVPIPKEITEYEEKIMFGMSLRKLICFSTAIIISIGTYFLCTKVLGLSMDTASYIIIIEVMPLLASGFIKKDGITFEKYFILFLRHKLGQNKLSYETEILINKIPDSNDKERKSKYDWIFRENNAFKWSTRKEQKAARYRREAEIYTITKKGSKRKRKEACKKIAAAKQEYKELQRRTKKKV